MPEESINQERAPDTLQGHWQVWVITFPWSTERCWLAGRDLVPTKCSSLLWGGLQGLSLPWLQWIGAELRCSNINIQLCVKHPGLCEAPHGIAFSPRDASRGHGSWRPSRIHKGVPDDSKDIGGGKETLPLARL